MPLPVAGAAQLPASLWCQQQLHVLLSPRKQLQAAAARLGRHQHRPLRLHKLLMKMQTQPPPTQ